MDLSHIEMAVDYSRRRRRVKIQDLEERCEGLLRQKRKHYHNQNQPNVNDNQLCHLLLIH